MGAKRYAQTKMTLQYISSKSGSERSKRRRSSLRNARKWRREGLRTLSSRMSALASDVRGRTWVASWGLTGLCHRDLGEDLQLVLATVPTR